jgi:L-alanine-DL-glutamate epimerase-like enolase superfamily enzyme
MRINKIECIPLTLRLKKQVLMSGGALSGATCVLVKIYTDEGITGIADAGGTSEWYSGETQESIMALIRNYYSKALLGENPFNIEKIMARLEKIAKNNNQSKAVIDYALHDIVGKKLGVPVYQLLGGKCREAVPLGYIISTGSPAETAAEARTLVSEGYAMIKVKMGFHSDEEDVENVRLVKQTVGNKAKVMIDANGGWNYFQALNILRQLEKIGVEGAEQPLPWWDIDGMARLRRKTDVPIFPDESATELNQVLQIIQKEAADGLFVKVAKAGGFLGAQRWVAIAKAAGLPVMCGAMVGSGFESAANAHFLVANEWMGRIEQESIGSLHLYNIHETVKANIGNDPARHLPKYENGCIYAPEGPGLGMELNEEVIPQLISPGLQPITMQ